MKRDELLRRIEELERQVRELQARPARFDQIIGPGRREVKSPPYPKPDITFVAAPPLVEAVSRLVVKTAGNSIRSERPWIGAHHFDD